MDIAEERVGAADDAPMRLGRWTIGRKFVGLSVVLLSIMLGAALWSFLQAARVNHETILLEQVLEPLRREIAAIEQETANEELATERALRYGGPQLRDPARHAEELARFEELNDDVDRRLTALQKAIKRYQGTEIPVEVAIILGRLQLESESVQRDHAAYRRSVGAYIDPAAPAMLNGNIEREAAAMGDEKRVLASLERMGAEADALARAHEVRLAEIEHRSFIISIESLLLAVMAFLAGTVLSLMLTRRMMVPVRSLIEGAEEVGRGNLNVSLETRSHDEIGQLSHAFSAMVGELKTKAAMKDTFSSYLDPRVVDRLLGERRAELEAGEKREMTVFFSDLQGFSSISETLTPTALVKLINRYLSLAAEPIQHHRGVIDKYIGDAIMAYWGPPFTLDEPALSAVQAALAQRAQIDQLELELPELMGLRRGAPKIAVRIGLASGDVVVGSIGSTASRNFTIMGDTVNIAARLEGANKAYGTTILADEATVRQVAQRIETREIDLLAAVGKSEAVRVYELLGEIGVVAEPLLELRERFEAGLADYRARDWGGAERAFADCLEIVPGDGPARVFAERVRAFRAAPPAADWDGVWQSVAK